MTGSRDFITGLSPGRRRALLVSVGTVLVVLAAVIVVRRRSAPAGVAPLAAPSPVRPGAAEPVLPPERLPSRWTGNVRRLVPVAALVAAVLVVGLAQGQSEPAPVAGPAPASPMISAAPLPNSSNSSSSSSCSNQADEPFTPSRITVPGVIRNAPVLALPRDSNDVPGVPPATDAGRWEFAWDRPPGIRPGAAKGNVLLNAHTFPDGEALGNRFLAELDRGDEIIVRGGDAELCYRVTKRIEVREADGSVAYYAREGPPQLALLVCSGTRLGPGEWTHRTIWFASPA